MGGGGGAVVMKTIIINAFHCVTCIECVDRVQPGTRGNVSTTCLPLEHWGGYHGL